MADSILSERAVRTVFGSKKDNEEYEYIENYFDSEVYGKPADRTQNAPKQLTSEYLNGFSRRILTWASRYSTPSEAESEMSRTLWKVRE